MRDKRIERDELYISIAHLLSLRGTCKRGKVGCVITSNNRIISTGYNGPLASDEHCTQCNLDEACKDAVHAEANAIAYAAKKGIKLEGSTLYCTHSPCQKCAELIIQSGIQKVVYKNPYRLPEPLELLGLNNVTTINFIGPLSNIQI